VNLTEAERTKADLNWTMFGIPVRVHPFFWLTAALLGWGNYNEGGIGFLLLWIGCVFVSILIHEMGHVVMGQVFGTRGHILLYAFGGLAIGSNALNNRWQRIAVSFAGPLAQFILLGGVLILAFALMEPIQLPGRLLPYFITTPRQPNLQLVIAAMLYVNLWWPLLNLLPIWPLDGGQIARDVLDWLRPHDGVRISLLLSTGLSGFLAANYLISFMMKREFIPFTGEGDMFRVIFFAMFAVTSYQLLQQMNAPRVYDEDRLPWERDPDDWRRGR